MNARIWFSWLLIFSFLSPGFPLNTTEAASADFTISVPEQYGTILHQSKGSNGPFVILIQDSHGQYEAQIQIRNILNHLIKGHSIKLVGLEGGSGQLHPEYFNFFSDKDANLKIADSLVQEGELSGAELAAIEHPQIQWVGLENIQLYRDNLIQFQTAHNSAQELQRQLQENRNQISKSKQKHFNKELLKFDSQRTRYHENRDGLLGYIKYLEKKSKHKFNPSGSGIEEFFNEVASVENQIYSKIIRTSAEREIIAKAKQNEILEKLSKLEATRTEYLEAIKKETDPSFRNSLKFYQQTLKRDEMLVSNLLSQASKERQNTAVLVSGGFHTPGIEKILRKKGVPHVTIIPKFNALLKNSRYLQVILNKSTRLENKSGAFNNKIAPALQTNEPLIYSQLNFSDPNHQDKIISGAYFRAISTPGSSKQLRDNAYLKVIFKNNRAVVYPKIKPSGNNFFAAVVPLDSNGSPTGKPEYVFTGNSLGIEPPVGNDVMDKATSEVAAKLILTAFKTYKSKHKEITDRAQALFEARDWKAVLEDAQARIKMYRLSLDVAENEVREILKDQTKDPKLWTEIKKLFLTMEADEYDSDLALTYFYSVMRRMYLENGTSVEYTDDGIKEDHEQIWKGRINKPYRTYPNKDKELRRLIKTALLHRNFKAPFQNIDLDAQLVAEKMKQKLEKMTGSSDFDSIEILNPTFFRNKGAYIAARIRKGGSVYPLVLALLHTENGIIVDAALMDEKNVNNVFSYTRSNFHVDISAYREQGDFLESMMPKKGRAAVYSAIGFIHPGKIELIKELRVHLRKSGERFELTKGIKGWVMVTFTLPSFPYVFKLIADFTEKEGTIKSNVKRKYQMVHDTDRAGRMLDSIVFKNLQFDKELFTEEVLNEIKTRAPTELVESKPNGEYGGEGIVLKHVYVQRKVTPLDIYLEEHKNDPAEISRVLEDWGMAMKGLAAAGIWVGDFKAKNYGVTSTGRVISFDYDELTPLSQITFQKYIPWYAPPDEDEGYHFPGTEYFDTRVLNKKWLPDELGKLGVSNELQSKFKSLHPELFDNSYWENLQKEIEEGKMPDVFPYALSERLKRSASEDIDTKQAEKSEGHSLGLRNKLDSIITNLGLKRSA